MQKVREGTNITLASVATDVLGLSGRDLRAAIAAGKRDTVVLADPAPATVRLRRVELAPGATMPSSARLTFAVPVEEAPILIKQPDGGISNDETTSVGVYVLTLEQDAEASPVAGTPAP